MDYEIKQVKGHYEVFVDGVFVVSADTVAEAVNEVESLLKARSENNDRLFV